MKIDIEKAIEIPEGVVVDVTGDKVKVKKDSNELEREFNLGDAKIVKSDKELKVVCKKATKREAKIVGTTIAHINNMIKGVGEDFVYKLEIANVHFPMNVKVEGDTVVIKSFLGETVDRVAKILPGVTVDVKGSAITVSGADIESVGQTAANLEKATRLTGRDRRIFQDGIFMTEKPGRVF